MAAEKLYHPQGVLDVALQSKGKGLEPLQQQKGVKGGNRRPGIPQEDRPDIGGEGSLARGIGKETP